MVPNHQTNNQYIINIWLVVEPTSVKNMNSSVGIMTFPINMESDSKFHDSSHHQAVYNHHIPIVVGL